MATKMKWTYNEKRKLLSRSLEADAVGAGARSPIDMWIRDFDDSVVFYNVGEKVMKREYAIDDSGSVNLGDSTEVMERTTYEEVKFSGYELSETVFRGPSSVKLEGLVFKLGNYPDKKFSVDAAEWDEKIVPKFAKVPIDIEHARTPSGGFLNNILGNDCGHLVSISRKGNDIFGVVELPNWLYELSGGKVGVSLAFNSDKEIVACALTLNPRVAGAEVTKAFSIGVIDKREENPTMNEEDKKSIIQGVVESVKSLFGGQPPANLPGTPATPTAPDASAKDAEIKALMEEREKLNANAVNAFAEAEFSKLLTEAKVVSAQKESLVGTIKQAILDDQREAAKTFSDGGTIFTGSRFAGLVEGFKKAPAHKLFGKTDAAGVTVLGTDPKEPAPNATDEVRARIEGGLSGF
jgi:hypothetical protein